MKNITSDRKKLISMIGIILFGVIAISIIDAVIMPPYVVKSAIKVVLFLGVPVAYCLLYNRDIRLKELFAAGGGGKAIIEAVLWGVGIFMLIIGAYLVIGRFFDFSQITTNLEQAMGIDRDNFVWVALYISLFNSLLEEFFFRGFACLSLQKYVSRRTAYIFSSLSFAAYHVAMMWVAFEPPLVMLSLVGLAVGGCIFNYFNEKHGSIYISWLIHMGANFAINGIAMSLFGLI